MPTDTAPTTELAPVELHKPKTLGEAKTRGSDIAVVSTSRGHMPAFTNMGQVMEYAAAMAGSGAMIRQPLRGNVGACLGIIETASRFGIAPFALAAKAYLVNDNIAYEAQAVMAMIYATGQIDGRLKYSFEGSGDNMVVTVTGRIKGEADILEYESPKKVDIKPQNSPLWKNDPKQQMRYFGGRAWCRIHAPDLLMGIYDVDEFDAPAATFVNVTPEKADPVTRLKANMAEARSAQTAAPDKPEPDPPATSQPIPVTDPDTDVTDIEPIAAETEDEVGDQPAAEAEPSVRELPPHPGELIRTKKGAAEYAERWATHYRALPADQEDAFIDATSEDARLAKALNPKAEDIMSDAINSPKTLV